MESSSVCTQKARKQHTCDWCCQKIEVGETYQRQAVFDSGTAYTFKNHILCMDLANKMEMFKDTYGEGLSPDDFCEHVSEYYLERNNREHVPFTERLDFALKQFKLK